MNNQTKQTHRHEQKYGGYQTKKWWGEDEEGNEGQIDGDKTLGGEHTMENANDVLQNCMPETYIMLLTDVTPIDLIFKRKV